ncbi:MAG: OmpA family protein [Clostridium chrysemydis]|uniref:OmpA family protein n=1 Tax=Clostridium TaxID=1485 RepID=UPI002152B904|nr:OmpA family protein [Clostridium sp. LY3-2]MCR6513550.1 OmpA family protein [Clostridium sp. LY3-2]
MARKKKKPESEGLKGDEWLGTYSDMVTLLLTFFILLYSMSSVDSEKLKQLSKAFNQVMVGTKGDSILQYDLYDGEVPLVGGESDNKDISDTAQSMYKGVKEFVKDNNLSDTVDITEDERGVILQLKDSILFQTGESKLKPESKDILNKINTLLKSVPNSIVVEGHTDNVPIHNSEYNSNWDLSTARAVTVVRYFIEEKGENPSRFSASGYGEYKPLVANNSDDNRAKNRRVNILIVANNKE